MIDKRRAEHKITSSSTDIEWINCGVCKVTTCHTVLATVSESDSSRNEDILAWESYSVVRCGGCRQLSFRHSAVCTEGDLEWDPDVEQHVLKPTITLYPSRMAGRALLADSYLLPSPVQEIYREAYAAQCNRLPIMTGIGVRSIVEAVCREKEIPGKDLHMKINALATAGHITPDGARVLHSLRFLGNRAVHEIEAPSEEELEAAFDVIEYLLNGVYTIPRRARTLPIPPP